MKRPILSFPEKILLLASSRLDFVEISLVLYSDKKIARRPASVFELWSANFQYQISGLFLFLAEMYQEPRKKLRGFSPTKKGTFYRKFEHVDGANE